MPQQELLILAIDALHRAGVEHMLTGSHVSSIQGEPRTTHDIDIVVALTAQSLDALLDSFPADRFYVARPAAEEAIISGGMFNVLDTTTGDKIDFWMLTDERFDQSRFNRRQTESIFGRQIDVSTPEDTVLMKLRWAMEAGGSEKQLNDVVHILELQSDALDEGYLDAWSERLRVRDLLDESRRRAREG
jgi:hypothetical protein